MPYFVAPDGCRIAYRDLGPRSAPPVMLFTMGTAAMSVWDPILPGLTTDQRVILHDRRGNGDSDPGAPDTHTFQTFRDDALGLMDHLGVQSAIMCGMAFGARVALRVALDAPARASRLILFDATGGPAAPEPVRRAGSEEAARLRAAAGIATPARNPAWFYRRDPAGDGLNSRAFRNQPDWIDGLATLSLPTLIACCEQDPNLEGARRLARDIPGSRFELMPMTGHASILDRPDLVLSLIRGFV